jgi:hypothetical protein
MFGRSCAVIALLSVAAGAALSACTHGCTLGLHDTIIIGSSGNPSEIVPCCGGFAFRDIAMLPSTDGQIAVTNIGSDQPVDVFVVPTSCSKLFDGTYPGSPALCQVYVGPLTAKQVSARVSLNAGTYRLWVQAYSANTASTSYMAQIDVLDYRCLPVLP